MKGFNLLEKLRLRHLLFVTLTLVSVLPVLLLEIWVERTAEQKEYDAIAEKHVLLANNLTESLNRYVIDVSGVFSFGANALSRGSSDPALLALLDQLHFRHLCILDSDGGIRDRLLVATEQDELHIEPAIRDLLFSETRQGEVFFRRSVPVRVVARRFSSVPGYPPASWPSPSFPPTT